MRNIIVSALILFFAHSAYAGDYPSEVEDYCDKMEQCFKQDKSEKILEMLKKIGMNAPKCKVAKGVYAQIGEATIEGKAELKHAFLSCIKSSTEKQSCPKTFLVETPECDAYKEMLSEKGLAS